MKCLASSVPKKWCRPKFNKKLCYFTETTATCCHLKFCQLLHSCMKNRIWKACSRNDLEGDSKSSKLPLSDDFLLVVCSNDDYLAPFPRHYHILRCMWLAVTLRSFAFEKIVEAMCARRWMCKHITLHFPRWDIKVSNSKSEYSKRSLKVTSNGAVQHSIYDFLLVYHCNYISI